MRIVKRSDKGKQRDANEDAVLCESLLDDYYLLAVADGMGGHQAGDVASRTTILELREIVTRALDDGIIDIESTIDRAVTKANHEIRALASDNPNLSGMGTTLVAALVRDGEAVIGNVGDSRAYLVGENIEQITKDQSLVRELVESGTIEADEAEDHPQRHVLAQALGTYEEVDPDFHERSLDGRTLLLCSDGLTEEVSDGTIREIVVDADSLVDAAETLVDRANENGGSDNVSVVLARYGNG